LIATRAKNACNSASPISRRRSRFQGAEVVPRYVGATGGDAKKARRGYFSWVEIDPKVVLSLVPMPLTVVIMTIEMPAAMSPYSIAVAAFSSFRNL
jgi:hypothetical protein